MAGPVTLKISFEKESDLERVGGTEFLADLTSSVMTMINAEDEGRTIDDLYMRRELIALGQDLRRDAYAPRKAVCSVSSRRDTPEAGFGHCPRCCARLPKAPGVSRRAILPTGHRQYCPSIVGNADRSSAIGYS
jgi:hypothetical protein